MDQVESRAERRVEPGIPLVVAGYPTQFTQDVVGPDNRIECRSTGFMKYTHDHHHDDHHLSIAWRDAYRVRGDEPPAHPAFDVGLNEPIYLKAPVGISGGPVFAVVEARSFEDFDPAKHCKLIGIAVKYTKGQRELALPWWRWIDWLRCF